MEHDRLRRLNRKRKDNHACQKQDMAMPKVSWSGNESRETKKHAASVFACNTKMTWA